MSMHQNWVLSWYLLFSFVMKTMYFANMYVLHYFPDETMIKWKSVTTYTFPLHNLLVNWFYSLILALCKSWNVPERIDIIGNNLFSFIYDDPDSIFSCNSGASRTDQPKYGTKIWDAQFDEDFSRFTPTKVKRPGHATEVKWEKFNAIKMLKTKSDITFPR